SVFLRLRQNIWSWPTAIVNVLLYTIIFFRAWLYADMGLQVVYAALSVYGWYEWLYGGAAKAPLSVSALPRGYWRSSPSLLGIASTAILGTLLGRYTDGFMVSVDSVVGNMNAVWRASTKQTQDSAGRTSGGPPDITPVSDAGPASGSLPPSTQRTQRAIIGASFGRVS